NWAYPNPGSIYPQSQFYILLVSLTPAIIANPVSNTQKYLLLDYGLVPAPQPFPGTCLLAKKHGWENTQVSSHKSYQNECPVWLFHQYLGCGYQGCYNKKHRDNLDRQLI